MDDVSSFSHRQLSTILKDPQHPHHAAAKAERDRRNMQNEVSDQMKARYIRQADQSHRAARSNEREAIRSNNPEKAKKYRDIMNKRNAGMTKAFGEAFGRANFTQQLKKKGIDVDKMHADNVKDAAAAKKRAAAASKDLTDFRKKPGMTSESKDDFEPHMMYDPKTGKGYKANKPEDHERMAKMGYSPDKPKVNEVSSNTLSNYMRKSAADAGKPRQDARTQDKRIGGQKMADDKLRKMDGKGSAAKVAATKEANTYVGQRDQMKITDRKPHPDGGHIVTLQTKAGKTIKRHLKNGKVKDIKEAQLDELTAAEKKLVNQMYDKKGNLTPMGKKVMNHGKRPGDKGYVESVNELSKDTMQSYWDKTKGDDAFSGSRKANNRLKGAINVTTKLDRLKKMVKK